MKLHRNAKLGLAGRFALVRAIEGGMSMKAAVGRLQRLIGNRTPHSSPRLLSASAQQQIVRARRRTGWGPRLLAQLTGYAHSTVWKVLRRAGLSRRARPPLEPANRCEWPCPGDLLHMDVARYARFKRPGHALSGDRSQRARRWMHPETRVGYDDAHALVDDHSRLAYVELHDDERAATATGFVERALGGHSPGSQSTAWSPSD